MEEINSHIVSRLKWNTTFDQKNEAYRLQERLSSWSKISLPGEVASIFNELCPTEQSWRIQSLELDLGLCDYNDLEFDLSAKIRHLLREKIAELIIYQNSQKQNLITVYNKEKSTLENLTVFLLKGYFPWNYQNKEVSVNQIMSELLQNNVAEILAVIKKEGIAHQEVRKRISWQFDEKNITKIIAALEPNNSASIIEFSSIMVNLQVKETIIQTSASSFKKNLWFFILNFLLLERGTLFNKLAFMKSSILQMANHYNIAYFDLILLIENTIVKLSDKTTQNNNFIESLKILTHEYEAQKKQNFKTESKPDYWTVFEELLTNAKERKSKIAKDNLNELIIALNNENKTKFNRIVNRILTSENACISLIQDLDETAIKILFSKLDKTSSSLNMETITYLNKLSSSFKLRTNNKVLWEIGITFLIRNKNADNAALLLFCIKELSKRNNLNPEYLLELFTSAKIPASIKNNNSIVVYTNLNAVYRSEINRNSSNYPAVHFKNLVVKLETELQKNGAKSVFFVDLQRSLIKNIYQHPKMAFEVMLSYGNKEFLKKMIPLVLNRELLQLLIKTTNYKKTKLVETIQIVYEILNAKEKFDLPDELLTDDLLLFGIEEILLHPKHNSSLFLETVILRLSGKVTNTKRSDYFHFITKLLQSKKIKSFGVSVKKNFLVQLKNNNSIDIVELALLIESTSQQAQTELSYLLVNNFNDSRFIALRKEDKKQSEIILHYFLKNGITIKNNWIKKQISSIEKQFKSISKTKITTDLNVIFWKTILNYNAYKGNEILLEKLIEKAFSVYLKNNYNIQNQSNINEKYFNAMEYNSEIKTDFDDEDANDFEIEDEIILEKSVETSQIELLFSGQNLSEQEKYDWCLRIVCQKQIPTGFAVSGAFEIEVLVNEIIIKFPEMFSEIIRKEFIPEAQIDWLSRNIRFNNLCAAIGHLDKNRESYLKILERFHHTLGLISIRGIAPKDMQSLLLRKLLRAAINDNWRLISIDKIWNELIWEVVTKKGVLKKNFIADIEKYMYQLPPSLQLSFKEVLNSEKQIIQKTIETELISKIELIKTNSTSKKPLTEGIAVRNAGIVILNSYVVMLFERLNLVVENEFKTIENQISAAQYLQYVVTGLTKTEEHFLPLNKVLCGLSLMHTIPDEIEISAENKILINGLIQAAISFWTDIGDCSVDGFRGNWLVRDGLLVELEDRWELTVDKKAYDVLINRSPFAFSIIKYPWMEKPLHVNWPY
ncbi:contractile injection system tape measure protein [Flavobacterium sp. N1736]|uniref:contractile injection system tape measure protein n=1 Tax=Flavobacterium sp. N1736 TaxID=2986823 RepID=UPI002224D346|nr:contractile injection system tape measure protein [Flavobacterium sp. N1736]